MSTEKPTREVNQLIQAARTASQQLLETWPGETRDKEGNLTEVRVVANGRPWMSTFDKKGKLTGFGYV